MYKVLVVLIALVVMVLGKPDDHYTTKYDGVDLDNILNNERLLQGYVNCLLDKGACAPDAAELKKVIPDALEHNCKKCSERQNASARKVLHFLFEKKQEIFKQLEAKYDPKSLYRNKYREEAAKEGLKI